MGSGKPQVRSLYRTPDGFYDLPFTWAFDGGQLAPLFATTQDALNQFVYVQGGWGDFVMRRCVGLGSVSTGSYLLRDSQKRPLSSDNIITPSFGEDDLLFPNELMYPETSIIGFDLYGVSLNLATISVEPLVGIVQAQIAFQGVRRLPIMQAPQDDQCEYDERTFTYRQDAVINNTGPAWNTVTSPFAVPPLPLNADAVIVQTINDYDFDLYQVMIEYSGNTTPIVAAVLIYDFARNRISNIPLLDCFYDGSPGSKYQNGAMVPPLRYKQNTQIRVELYSLSPTAPVTATVHLIGRQRLPKGTR